MNNNADQPARINLARCNIGQLIIRDFDERDGQISFPHSVNLLAIKVDDWRLKKDRFCALLEKTEPFDADNYIDIEHRLARIGDKELANEVYRAMKSRSGDDHDDGSVESSIVWERFLHWFDRLPDRLRYWSRLDLWLERLNGLFSGHGTRPLRMVSCLLIFMIPVIWVLANPRNVEFLLTVNDKLNVNVIGTPYSNGMEYKTGEFKEEVTVIGTPYSDGEKYDLKQEWGLEKAIGLSMSYAIPFYGSRPEVVRARLNGGTCLGGKPSSQPIASNEAGSEPNSPHPKTTTAMSACNDLPLSPHEFAMVFSVIQFIIWVFIAANLPTIIRRRS